MDRLDAMRAFALAADSGGLSAAARKLGCSPAAVTRAVSSLEAHVGAPLLRRTTRKVVLTEAGERYLVVVRRVLAELESADREARGDTTSLSGPLTVTAPLALGARHVRPILDEYLARYPDVRARLLLVDRVVSLVDEGVDVAVRIAFMPDSALVATKVGVARRLLCASPEYLAREGTPQDPGELAGRACVIFTGVTATDTWSFTDAEGDARRVRVRSALTVNTAEAAVGSALEGRGIVAALSYQIARELEEGRLVRILSAFEPAPFPVHLVQPAASASLARVRAFVELAVPRLRAVLASRSRGEAG